MANEIYHRSNWGNAVNDKYWADVYEKYSATNKMYVRSDYYENSNETDKLMADIYPKPSILLTPTAYDNGSLHSVKPVQTFGSELSVNGDFATDSDWTKGTNWTIANGKATVTNSTTSSIFQDILNVSKKYKVTFQITEITSGSLRIGIGQNFSDYFTQVGTYTYYGKIFLDTLLRINPSSGTNASIDYVSVKEVIDADFQFSRNSSATRVNEKGLIEDVQILSGNLVQNGDFSQIGSEEVINGDFATDSDWTKQSNWTIANGSANSNGSGLIYQTSVSYVDGKIYKVTFDANITSGGGTVRLGNTTSSTSFTNGANEFYLQTDASNTTRYIFFQGNSLVGSIDNVSVKEVGQNWEFNSTAIFTDNGINITTGGYIRQDVVTAGKKYKLTYDIVSYTSGSIRVYDGTDQGNIPTNLGSNTFNFTAGGSVFYIQSNSVNVNLTITNISVIEITDDTDLPRINYTNFDYVDVLGDELVTNGYYEQSGIGNVISQSGGVLVNENNQLKISSNGSSAYSRGVWATGGLEGDTFLVEADIISTSGSVRFYDQSNNGTYTDLVVGSRYQRYIVLGSNDKNLGFGGNNDVNFELVLDNVSIKKFTEDVVVPYSGTGSLLLEPQRTNNVVNSNSSFITNNTTITYNNINSPEGIQNAFKVECTSSGTAVFARTNDISFTDETFSLFVKYGNTQYLQFLTSNTSAHFFNFDVQNGVFGTKGASTSNLKVVEYTNGWYRVSGYFTGGSGTGSFRVYLSNSNSASYGAASATSGDFLYSYGWQIENGSYPTSYIPTLNGSTVTRLADVCNNAGSSDLISSTSGVLYAEGYFEQTGLTNGLFAISDGTFNNFLMVRFGPINKLQIESTGGVNIIEPNARNSGNYKIAAKYDSNGVQLWVDGYKVIETSSQSTMSGVNQLMVGKSPYGNIVGYKNKCVAVFKEALDNDQLERLTGEGYESFNLLAQANNYTII